MMSINLIQSANKKYNAGLFEEALIDYEKAALEYGENLVRANIKICRKKIENAVKQKSSATYLLCVESKNDENLGHFLREGLGIEHIYIVNLSRRLDRFVRAIREMNVHDLACTRVEGVDAKYSILAQKLFTDFKARPVTEKRKSSAHISTSRLKRFKNVLTVGAFGYLLSQKKVFEDAKKNGYKKILVLDDDVFWHSQSKEKIIQLSQRIGDSYKLLLLGSSEYSERDSEEFTAAFVQESEYLYHPIPDRTCGSFAVAYDNSVYNEVLDAIAEADGPFDNVTLGSLYTRFRDECFAVTPAICIPNVDDSDIRESERTQIAHSERMSWETLRFLEFKRDFNIGIIASSFSSLKLVAKLKKAIFPGVNISIFYPTEDGLRPVIPGHEFAPKDEQVKAFKWSEKNFFRSLIDDYNLPSADIYISWPEEREITGENVIKEVSNILQLVNLKESKSGLLGSYFYCAEYKKKTKKGRHSIIIPCFRSIDESLETIKSALLQDASDFEVIVINDNPETKDFVKTLQARLKKWSTAIKMENLLDRLIVLEHKINRNASAARNTGLFSSSGEWVSFLDDDDYFEPDRLSAVESTLVMSGNDVGACYCGYTGKWNGEVNMDRFPEGNLREKVISLKYTDHYMCTNTVTFKRTALEEIGGFDEGYKRHQDLELMARFFEKYEIKAVKKFLVKNRPAVVSPTFKGDIRELSRLKLKFLRDLAPTLDKKDSKLLESVINAHVADILKKHKDASIEMRSLACAMLEEVLS
jgi:glycosyltransferase involved in cell wall biosynthesis